MQTEFIDTRDSITSDREEIGKAIDLLFQVAAIAVLELRILRAKNGGTVSGYFDSKHQPAFVESAEYWSGKAEGVYVTLNPVVPDVLCRSANRITKFAKHTTGNTEIERRVWLLIDLDAKRPAGISATRNEHEAALDRARSIRDWLTGQGWPQPIFTDSGNGGHLLYRIDLPNDAAADALVRGVLKAIAAKWDDPSVTVDQSVHNAARIVKLPGTLAAKGDHTPDNRPHRIARMIDVPGRLEIVPLPELERVAAMSATASEFRQPGIDAPSFDAEAWLRRHGIGIRYEKPFNGGRLFELDRCPWRPDQTDGGPCVIQHADGGISASCRHSKCAGKGWADLRAIYEPIAGSKKQVAGSLQPIEDAADPHRLARLFLRKRYSHVDGPTLKYWRGEWHRWHRGAWQRVPPSEIRAELSRIIKEEFDRLSIEAQGQGASNGNRKARKVTAMLVNNVVAALEGESLLSAEIEQPAWLNGADDWPANEVLAARNGLIHLPTLELGVRPPTPRYFAANVLDFDFDITPPTPVEWIKFLDGLWRNDRQSIDTLQDWMGYLLTNDTRQQKILMLVGPPRSGKGTIARVITALLGKSNVAGPTLSGLQSDFGLAPLLGKPVAIVSDARLNGRADAAVVERLLTISGEDAITVNRKYVQPVTVVLPTRIMILTNELPELPDASGALAKRMLALPLMRSFCGEEDTGLSERLCTELPGILLWCREGWLRLRGRGRFIEPDSSKELMAELHDLGSPVKAFVEDRCEVGEGYEVQRQALYEAFSTWCEEQGWKIRPKAAQFGRNLRAAIAGIGDRQATIGGKKLRLYTGIRLVE